MVVVRMLPCFSLRRHTGGNHLLVYYFYFKEALLDNLQQSTCIHHFFIDHM